MDCPFNPSQCRHSTVLQVTLGLEISSLLIASWLTLNASLRFQASGRGLKFRCQWELQKPPEIRDFQDSGNYILYLTLCHFSDQNDYPSHLSTSSFSEPQSKMEANATATYSEYRPVALPKIFWLASLNHHMDLHSHDLLSFRVFKLVSLCFLDGFLFVSFI